MGSKHLYHRIAKGEINVERTETKKAETNRIGERMRVTEREICGSFRESRESKATDSDFDGTDLQE